MADLETLLLARAMKQIAGTGMQGHEASAVANATIGLAALAATDAPVPLDLIREWEGCLNRIRTSRRNPGPPKDQSFIFHEDGAPG